jgi:hypothetical protein
VIKSPAGGPTGWDADTKPQDAVGCEEAAPAVDDVRVPVRLDAKSGNLPIFSAFVKNF